jgi:pilus assembly protein CpaD
LTGRDEDMQMITLSTPPSRPRALRALAALLLAGAAAALGACQHTEVTGITDPAPADYRQRHPIAVREGERTVELFIGHARGGLTPAQRADVAAFAHTWRRESTGGILIDVPAGTGNARPAHEAVHEARAILVASGVPASAIGSRPYQPEDPRIMANLRLRYPKMVASAGPCGLWPHDIGPSFDRKYNENGQYWNFGCASQRNLAAMVENPADLVQPRGDTPVSAGRRSTVLEKYRKGESSATVYPDANKGKISDVGQ